MEPHSYNDSLNHFFGKIKLLKKQNYLVRKQIDFQKC